MEGDRVPPARVCGCVCVCVCVLVSSRIPLALTLKSWSKCPGGVLKDGLTKQLQFKAISNAKCHRVFDSK